MCEKCSHFSFSRLISQILCVERFVKWSAVSVQTARDQVHQLEDHRDIGWLRVDMRPIKHALSTHASKWIWTFTKYLSDQVCEDEGLLLYFYYGYISVNLVRVRSKHKVVYNYVYFISYKTLLLLHICPTFMWDRCTMVLTFKLLNCDIPPRPDSTFSLLSYCPTTSSSTFPPYILALLLWLYMERYVFIYHSIKSVGPLKAL